MSISQRRSRVEPLDWVLVANAARARCFERNDHNHALRELACFVHPEGRQKGTELADDRGGLVHKGVASTQYQPHTDVHKKEHEAFARELAQYLDDAVLAHRCPGLVLLASSAFLGELRSHLGKTTAPLLKASIALDLTSFSGTELEQRVTQALQSA
jgi:protein required for attachment to host cells